MRKRDFLKAGAIGGLAAAPVLANAQSGPTYNWKMATGWASGPLMDIGSKAFAERMTKTARALGMNRTTFKNASGLPNLRQMTTARDMAKLGLALQRDFPQHYHFFSTREFDYKGTVIRNHNNLLGFCRSFHKLSPVGGPRPEGSEPPVATAVHGHATCGDRDDALMPCLRSGTPNQVGSASGSNGSNRFAHSGETGLTRLCRQCD